MTKDLSRRLSLCVLAVGRDYQLCKLVCSVLKEPYSFH